MNTSGKIVASPCTNYRERTGANPQAPASLIEGGNVITRTPPTTPSQDYKGKPGRGRVPLLRASKADRAVPGSPLKDKGNPGRPGSPTKSFKG